jgi:cytochrome o ubiquinol oxidase subunit II
MQHRPRPASSHSRPGRWSVTVVPCLLVIVATVLSAGGARAADVSFLDPQGPIAAAQRTHFFHVILLMMVVVLPVLVLTPLLAWRYRYGNKSARYTPKWRLYEPLEVVIWGVPLAVVTVLGFWLAHATGALDPYRPLQSAEKPLRVDVIGYDWKWLFVYPQLHIASVGQLVFPAHTPIAMRLTSDSVMQSFFIPALGSQIYAMAAMQTKLHLMADSTGQFLGENTQYDGAGFQDQKFIARATTPEGFRDWIADVRAHGVPLTAAAYDAIRKRNTVAQLRTALKAVRMPPDAVFFNHVPQDLFARVMRSFHGGPADSVAMVGGAGPGAERSGRHGAGMD